jgi:hypothetical protein
METGLRTTLWRAPHPAVQRLMAAVGFSLAVSLVLAGGMLLVRRISGAAVMPLGGWHLVASGGVLAALAWIVRWSWAGGCRGASPGTVADLHHALARVMHAVPGVTTGLVLLAISHSASGVLFLAAAWLVWLASEAAAWHWRRTTKVEQAPAPSGAAPAVPPCFPQRAATALDGSTAPCVPATAPPPHALEDETELLPANLVQQVTRLIDEEGERVQALARVPIEAGDSLGVLHLAFGPPLAGHPHLAAEVVDEPRATARVTDAETYGARVEVRLPQAVPQSRTVWVEVHGLAPSSSSRDRAQPSP